MDPISYKSYCTSLQFQTIWLANQWSKLTLKGKDPSIWDPRFQCLKFGDKHGHEMSAKWKSCQQSTSTVLIKCQVFKFSHTQVEKNNSNVKSDSSFSFIQFINLLVVLLCVIKFTLKHSLLGGSDYSISFTGSGCNEHYVFLVFSEGTEFCNFDTSIANSFSPVRIYLLPGTYPDGKSLGDEYKGWGNARSCIFPALRDEAGSHWNASFRHTRHWTKLLSIYTAKLLM